MSYSLNPEFKKQMEKAEPILGEQFKDFEQKISKYEAKLNSPEWDIICFYFYQRLKNKKTKLDEWIRFWSTNRKPKRYANFSYFVPDSYYNFCCSKETSEYLFEILDYHAEQGLKLSWNTFLQIFFDYRSKIMPKFNKLEFQVFQTILREQTLSNSELLTKLSMDSSNLSKYKRKLRERFLIYEGLSINHYVLNLVVYAIVYNVSLSLKIDFFKELPESSFLHSIYTSYSNSQTTMIHYLTPDNVQVKKDLQTLCEKINNNNDIISSEIYKFDLTSRLKSLNFSNYDYKNAKWDLPFYKIVASLKAKDTSESTLIIGEFDQIEKKELNLHKSGIEILNHMLMRNEMSINAIKNDLELSEKEARKQVENLHKKQYFKTRINPNYVFGLSNLVLFLSKEPSKQLEIHKQLSIFPEVYSQKYNNEEEEGLHFIIRIPNEMIFDSMSLFNDFFKEDVKEMFVVNQMYSRRWLLPIERYETVFQEWKYDSTDILGKKI
ncbi:MAG: hypothetical protein GPJ51_02670 [Candidatus Heimdallarchaeota archaeon]|nr:hypothetical protein [Candidatus Heimdallarchaeota archaeon]